MKTNEKPNDSLDDGCPHGDPDCMARADECHWACTTFSERDNFLIADRDGTTLLPSQLEDDERAAVLATVLGPDDVVVTKENLRAIDTLRTEAQALLASSADDEFLDTDAALDVLQRLVAVFDERGERQ